jgi:predicted amidohydrolase
VVKDEVRVSLVQFASAWLDRETNARRMADFVDSEAAEHSADLVVFPELATTGYVRPASDTEFARRLYEASEPVPGPTTEALADAARRNGVHVIFGVSEMHPQVPQVLYNSAVLLGPDGSIIGTHHKVHACLDEKNYYVPGSTVDVHDTQLGAIALNICYDVRFPELARVQALKGAELIVSLWASFVQQGKVPDDSIINRCATRAMENGLFFLGCNRSGVEGDRVFYGRSAVAGPSGEILAASSSAEEEVVRALLTADDLRSQRQYLTIFRDRRPELYGALIEPL